jgi:hypothetical protein
MIELPNAFESRAKRNLGHGEPRFIDKLSRQMNPVRRCDLKWGRTEVLHEETAQLARADS